ncbi:MAG TPA: hypothetical protein VKR59_13130 [Terriglobales bacterium]|nr:hypothetical protein [Terriglobales bacterium]
MRVEELQTTSSLADQELEKQQATLRKLTLELERVGDSLAPGDYAARRAAISQQESRVSAASRIACNKRMELDAERQREIERLARENAERLYQARLNELRSCDAEIYTTRQTIAELQSRLPVLAQKKNILLYEIDKAKSALPEITHV